MLTKTDADIADTHQYSLVAGAGDYDNADFLISNDSLFSQISYNYEDTAMKYIRIKTVDTSAAFFEKAFVINIVDVYEINPGFDEFALNQTIIYPNPSEESLNFSLVKAEKIKKIEILDVNGKILHIYYDFDDKISIANLNQGIYFIRLSLDNDQSFTRRFVKK